jgi:predicted phosphohydrolase
MSKFLWLTDIHLNFLSQDEIVTFARSLCQYQAQGIFLTGDISTGPRVLDDLSILLQEVNCPVYFVLGNHDFYRSSFAKVRQDMDTLSQECNHSYYLTTARQPLEVAPGVAVIGHDGWYDARWREPLSSLVFLYDFFLIKDFRAMFAHWERLDLARDKAQQAVEKITAQLRMALKDYDTVYLLTHFPPWPEATPYHHPWMQRFWVPYSTSKVMADALKNLMVDFPTKQLVVLAGHTHETKEYQPAANIRVKVGSARFGHPIVQGVIDL